jgi:hypothetical protein
MNQHQQPCLWRKDTWKDQWPISALIATTLVIFLTGLLGYWRSWERPFWDWLGLLIIPVLLGLGGIWFNNQTRKSEQELASRERENDREIAKDRVREDALQRYLDRMSELVLDKNLRESKPHDAMRTMARARTLTVLRSLDGNRKGQVARFLHESEEKMGWGKSSGAGPIRLKTRVIEAIIDLQDADLGGANLRGVNLSSVRRWTNKELAQASSLVGATMPDGTKMTEEAWEEFKKHSRR